MDLKSKLESLKRFYAEMPGKDYFELLGIERTASDSEVRSAYFGLMKMYGADYFRQVENSKDRAIIEEVNRVLRAAYDTLGKSAKREEYLNSQKKDSGAPNPEKGIDIATVFEAEQAMTQAKSLIERGEFNVAKQRLEKAKSIDPNSVEVRVRLAYVTYMLMEVGSNGKRSSLAVKEITEQIESAKEELPVADYLYEYLGDIAKIEGESQKALTHYKQALKLNSENVRARREVMLMEKRKNDSTGKPNAGKKDDSNKEEPTTFLGKLKALLNKKL
ncbi:MAG: DnaJ domain-containing protein [Proteobacteria bacterium]|nr:DnaJ domain-containing protein [Pseudomonadota bacterium]